MRALPTIIDVATHAGVSRQTVSNVLNYPDRVRPDTKQRVEAAIAALGYRPHVAARRLRTQRSATLGVRLDRAGDGISGAVLDGFLHALTEHAAAAQHSILLYTADSAEQEIEAFRRLRDAAAVDAFVLTSTFHGDPRTEWLVEQHVPFVTFGRPWGAEAGGVPRHPWVDVDGRRGVFAATADLLERGYRDIAFLGWPSPSGTGDDRRSGWFDAMRTLTDSPDCSQLRDLRCLDGVGQAVALMSALVERGDRPDAIVCASDALALGARLATGQHIPVVGFDNTPVAAAMGMSSVDQSLEAVAAEIITAVTEAIAGVAVSTAGVLVEPVFVPRYDQEFGAHRLPHP